MSLKYTVNKQNRTVTLEAEKHLAYADLNHSLNEVLDLEGFGMPKWVEVLDLTSVETLDLGFRNCNNLRQKNMKLRGVGCHGTVIHAKGDLAFGVSRMMQQVHAFEGYPVLIAKNDEELHREIETLRG